MSTLYILNKFSCMWYLQLHFLQLSKFVHVVPWVSVIGPPLLKSSKMPFPEHCAVTGKTLAENLAGCPPLAEGQVGFRPLYLPFFLMIFTRISFLPRQRSTRIAASPVMGCGDVCRESFLLWRTLSRRLGTYRFYGVIWLQRVRLLRLQGRKASTFQVWTDQNFFTLCFFPLKSLDGSLKC